MTRIFGRNNVLVVYSTYLMPKQTSQPTSDVPLLHVCCHMAATRDYFLQFWWQMQLSKMTNAFLQCTRGLVGSAIPASDSPTLLEWYWSAVWTSVGMMQWCCLHSIGPWCELARWDLPLLWSRSCPHSIDLLCELGERRGLSMCWACIDDMKHFIPQ